MIQFGENADNQLLLNPRWPDEEKKVLNELKNEFEKKVGGTGYFFIPSSGSSQQKGHSSKLIVLRQKSVLNSAARVNLYLNAQPEDSWCLVLPEFHVAGLGVRARAHLSGAEIYQHAWQPETLISSEAAFASLVPAQVADIVALNLRAPASFKKVFVGAGALTKELSEAAQTLGWPIVETYGMTETCSMVAVRDHDEWFRPLPGVQLRRGSTLEIKCNSLLSATLQKQGTQTIVQSYDSTDWFKTEDLVELSEEKFQFKGRENDYIKILGEGVSLLELRMFLAQAAQAVGISTDRMALVPVADQRNGYQLVLATETIGQEKVQGVCEVYNQLCRPYEKIKLSIELEVLPRTDLGKLKLAELKSIIEEKIQKGHYGQH